MKDDQSIFSYDEDLLRDSQKTFFRSLSMDRTSVKEILKDLGIGQYMTQNQNQLDKVSKLWKQMLDVIALINQQNYSKVKNQKSQSGFYIVKKQVNGAIQITSNPNLDNAINKTITKENLQNQSADLEILQQIYPFIYTDEDRSVIQLLIVDLKGLKFLIRLGPPANLRWSCWKALIFENFQLIGKYESMLDRINQKKQDDQSQIIKDIQRTLVSHQYFQKNNQYGLGQQQLLRVLQAIAIRLPSLGYCQGMNFIAGFLLMVSGGDEKLSYESFLSLLINPKYLLYYLYADGLPMLLYLQHIIHQFLFEYDQELSNHIEENCVPDSIWITKMILTIFIYVYRLNKCLRIWDYILSRGLFGIVELILSTAYITREQMLNSGLEEFGQLFQGQDLLKNGDNRLDIDVELLIFHASNNYKLKKEKIVEATNIYILAKQIPKNSIIHCFLQYQNTEIFYDIVNQFNQKLLSIPEDQIIIDEQNL